jgi:hypothetical protein
MRTLFGWTVIFRGSFYTGIINVAQFIKLITIFIIKLNWYCIRIFFILASFIIGIDWFAVERRIERKIKIYFA